MLKTIFFTLSYIMCQRANSIINYLKAKKWCKSGFTWGHRTKSFTQLLLKYVCLYKSEGKTLYESWRVSKHISKDITYQEPVNLLNYLSGKACIPHSLRLKFFSLERLENMSGTSESSSLLETLRTSSFVSLEMLQSMTNTLVL